MARNSSWLGDAYTASKTRKPMDLGGSSLGGAAPVGQPPALPPSMMTGGPTAPKLGGALPPLPGAAPQVGGGGPMGAAPSAGPLAGMPSLAAGAGAGAGASPKSPMMTSLLAALQHAHTTDANANGIPDSQEGGGGAGPTTASSTLPPLPGAAPTATAPAPLAGMPNLSAGVAPGMEGMTKGPRPPAPPPPTTTLPPQGSPPQGGAAPTAPTPGTVPPPLPGSPGYVGPGPIGSPTGGYSSPGQNIKEFQAWLNRGNWDAWTKYGALANSTPGMGTAGWLSYLMADPYNRMVTDASERESLDATNTAFDAARGRMKADALQSGAGQSGVARGMSKGLELSRGATQAKNVRDFEKYKVDLGDKRLKDMGLQWLNLQNASRGQSQSNQNQGSNSDDYLKLAVTIASLFA